MIVNNQMIATFVPLIVESTHHSELTTYINQLRIIIQSNKDRIPRGIC